MPLHTNKRLIEKAFILASELLRSKALFETKVGLLNKGKGASSGLVLFFLVAKNQRVLRAKILKYANRIQITR